MTDCCSAYPDEAMADLASDMGPLSLDSLSHSEESIISKTTPWPFFLHRHPGYHGPSFCFLQLDRQRPFELYRRRLIAFSAILKII